MCYRKPHTGYNCTVTSCQFTCASGTTDCLGLGCAANAAQCGFKIADVTTSVIEALAFFTTDGAGGVAVDAVTTSARSEKLAKDSAAITQMTNTLYGDLDNFLTWSEAHLASTSTSDVEAAVAASYGRDTYNYKWIAREWAMQELLWNLIQTELDLTTFVTTAADPTGITGTLSAFNNPVCSRHTSIPTFN